MRAKPFTLYAASGVQPGGGSFLLHCAESCDMLAPGKKYLSALPVTVGGWPSRQGAASCPLIFGKGGCPMVTYSDLIQIGILIVGICGLFLQVHNGNKEVTALLPTAAVTSASDIGG